MRVARGHVAALLLLIASAGCGTFAAHGRADLDTITRAQLDQNNFHNALEAVQALHSNWLNVRSKVLASAAATGQPGVVVYLDEVRLGGVSELNSIETQRIQYIRHYSPVDATQKWGVGHTEGAIQISTQPM